MPADLNPSAEAETDFVRFHRVPNADLTFVAATFRAKLDRNRVKMQKLIDENEQLRATLEFINALKDGAREG